MRAYGTVNVRVLIDERGNVISAGAVSGHPMLRQSAESAARASKFAPTVLGGQPVKITGILHITGITAIRELLKFIFQFLLYPTLFQSETCCLLQ
jgi:TonB family protein